MKKYFLFLCIAIRANVSFAQPTHTSSDSIVEYTDFFKGQALEYQKWLDQSGLGNVLKVQQVDPRPGELPLYLGFHYQEVDSIQVAWDALKTKFDKERPTTLEQELFYKMVYFMEVPDSVANVQIYHTYDVNKPVLFFRGIYSQNGQILVDTGTAKGSEAGFSLSIEDFDGLQDVAREVVNYRLAKKELFGQIVDFARLKYRKQSFNNGGPKMEIRDSLETLRFEVKDLKREVLTDAEQPFWCEIAQRLWGSDCDWMKREMLGFTIVHTQKEVGKIQLGITIDGKVGSGYYKKIRDNGYRPMEVDFNSYLERYAEKFRLQLRQYLITGKIGQ